MRRHRLENASDLQHRHHYIVCGFSTGNRQPSRNDSGQADPFVNATSRAEVELIAVLPEQSPGWLSHAGTCGGTPSCAQHHVHRIHAEFMQVPFSPSLSNRDVDPGETRLTSKTFPNAFQIHPFGTAPIRPRESLFTPLPDGRHTGARVSCSKQERYLPCVPMI